MNKQKFLEIDEDENIIMETKRHPIGLAPIYSFGTFVVLLFIAMGMGLPLIEELSSIENSIFYIIFFLLAGFAAVITYVGVIVYKGNELILTNESLVQILRKSLFSRRISQLSLSSVQDVTVEQPNFLSNIFNYGTITVETAGEQANFIFRLAREPFTASKQIIEAAEQFQEEHGFKEI